MAPSPYNTVAGLIQFDPEHREVEFDDETVEVTDVLIQAIGSGGKNVKITIWDDVVLSKGQFLVAQGKFQVRNVNGKEYISLSANQWLAYPDFNEVKKKTTRRKKTEDTVEEDDSLF